MEFDCVNRSLNDRQGEPPLIEKGDNSRVDGLFGPLKWLRLESRQILVGFTSEDGDPQLLSKPRVG